MPSPPRHWLESDTGFHPCGRSFSRLHDLASSLTTLLVQLGGSLFVQEISPASGRIAGSRQLASRFDRSDPSPLRIGRSCCRVRIVLAVPIRLPSMFMPATPHVSALWASVPSSGFIARTIGSQAGLSALAQPVHCFARLRGRGRDGAFGGRIVQVAVDLVRSAIVSQRIAGPTELRADRPRARLPWPCRSSCRCRRPWGIPDHKATSGNHESPSQRPRSHR